MIRNTDMTDIKIIYDGVLENTIEFKKLHTMLKYSIILMFCEKHNTLPYYKSENKNEQQMRRFLINKWNKQKRFKAKKEKSGVPADELPMLNEINKYKETVIDKIRLVLAYCIKYKSTPPYDAVTEEDERANKRMVSLKNLKNAGKLSKKEQKMVNRIDKYKKESRLDKLKRLLKFCVTNNRTPKQHVKKVKEKKLGEFLSTVKRIPDEKLSSEEKDILDSVLAYAPKPRKNRRKELLGKLTEYVTKYEKAPKNSRFGTDNEQELGKFYIKLRWLNNRDKLNDVEKREFNDIQKLIFKE